MTTNNDSPNRGLLVVAGLVVIALGVVGIVVFPDDQAVRFPISGLAIGIFLIVMGSLIAVVNFVKRNR